VSSNRDVRSRAYRQWAASLRREAAGREFEAIGRRRLNALHQDRRADLRRYEPAENQTDRKGEYFSQKSCEELSIVDAIFGRRGSAGGSEPTGVSARPEDAP
jgi:hypothetical protein